MSARLGACGAVLALSLAAGRALGDASGIAIELFAQGKQLMNAGDYVEARVRLIESARLDPKVGTLASLAVCEERLRHLSEARARWLQARTLAVATDDPRKSLTETELARVDRVVPKLRIELRGPEVRGLVIRADDLEVGPGMLATPLPVDPGDHTVSATAPGLRPWSTLVHTEADGKINEVLVGPLEEEPRPAVAPVPPAASAASAAPASPAPSEPGEVRPGSTQRTIGIVVAGLGVAGMAVGGAFGFRALALKRDRNDLCDANNVCDAQGVGLDRDARSAATASTIAFAVGGAVAAGGVLLFFAAPRATAIASVAPLPGGAGVQMIAPW